MGDKTQNGASILKEKRAPVVNIRSNHYYSMFPIPANSRMLTDPASLDLDPTSQVVSLQTMALTPHGLFPSPTDNVVHGRRSNSYPDWTANYSVSQVLMTMRGDPTQLQASNYLQLNGSQTFENCPSENLSFKHNSDQRYGTVKQISNNYTQVKYNVDQQYKTV